MTNVELFFDLVFAFAVTQLSHRLLANLTLLGAVETLIAFMATWWVWIFTAWVTNWLDPERTPVRLLLFAMMLVGVLFAAAIPEAFDAMGWVFAGAYVALQLGRALFTLWALGGASPANTRNFRRIASWAAFAALFWIAGAAAAGEMRLVIWLAALAIDYVSPAAGFRVPGLGRSTTADWDVEGGHIAERCSQFIIIALGESVVVSCAAFADLAWSADTIAGFVAAFAGSAALWWIYFDTGLERGARRITEDQDPGRLARFAYTYVHLPIVAGIVVEAVADDLMLAHAHAAADPAATATMLGGPALYLVGNILFKTPLAGRVPLSHLVGLVLLAGLAAVSGSLTLLEMGIAVSAALVVVAVWERLSLGSAGD